MNTRRLAKQALKKVDLSLLEGTGSGGILSVGYFNDGPIRERLRDGERVDFTFQNHTRGLNIKKRSEIVRVRAGINYRTAALVTDTRILFVVGHPHGDKTFSVPLSRICNAEISTGLLKDRITVFTSQKAYEMYVRKQSNAKEAVAKIRAASRPTENNNSSAFRSENEESQHSPGDRPVKSGQPGVPDTTTRSRDKSVDYAKMNEPEHLVDYSDSIEIHIFNQGGSPVVNATVQVTGFGFNTEGKTSDSGQCMIELPAGADSIKVEIAHPEYETVRGEVLVKTGAVIDVTLTETGSEADDTAQGRDVGNSATTRKLDGNKVEPSRRGESPTTEWNTQTNSSARRIGESTENRIRSYDTDDISKSSEDSPVECLVGLGGTTETDAEILVDAGYETREDLESASLEDLRNLPNLDGGVALRIKAELG